MHRWRYFVFKFDFENKIKLKTKSSHVVKYDQSALQGSWNASSAEKTLHITHTHILRGHIILNPPPVSVCSIWSSSQGGYFPREREAVK